MTTVQDARVLIRDPEGVDPEKVPKKVLESGAQIPCIGLGTFGNDCYDGETIAEAVQDAISLGYRHIDCASVYGNEDYIGQSLQEAMKRSCKREALWITSKLWNDKHAGKDVIPSCEKSLKDLRLDYLDL
jgi:diketogulonate reductase-like aldo/keto reductase